MNSMGRFRTLISKGVNSVSTPFHPFGGAVDLIVIKQKDGSYKSTPWYVRFGKFQGVLKRTEEFVRINVDGVEANFHMHLTKSGEAFFVKGVQPSEDSVASGNSENCEPGVHSPNIEQTSVWESGSESPLQQFTMTNIPTSEQIASLNLKDGQNMITFSFTTRVLGMQQIHAHVYLWKWNSHIVISDVDGTITRSNALGQVMHLVGKDWTQSGVARLFSAIKENGYQLLFLSARAIAQAYLTRSFLFGVNQDGETIPYGPVVTSPDGLFPSLYREVIRRNPHEFKISCLEDIRRLFPSDHNPFYGGFGNRDTDKVSYMKMGIPEGRIFTINPKGEVVNCGRTDVKCYTSLHTLVHEMFPPIPSDEKER